MNTGRQAKRGHKGGTLPSDDKIFCQKLYVLTSDSNHGETLNIPYVNTTLNPNLFPWHPLCLPRCRRSRIDGNSEEKFCWPFWIPVASSRSFCVDFSYRCFFVLVILQYTHLNCSARERTALESASQWESEKENLYSAPREAKTWGYKDQRWSKRNEEKPKARGA